MDSPVVSRLAVGDVVHHRHLPVKHRFFYPMFFMLINLQERSRLNNLLFGFNRKAISSFLFSDHGDGRDPEIWTHELLQSQGVRGCDHRIWVQTMPRLLGYLFNPVSFWYCENQSGDIGAIIAEVNNTFDERHCYVLTPNPQTGRFHQVKADKVMHVSPFYTVKGEYRFSFNVRFDHPAVVIDYYDHDVKQLHTMIHGRSRPWSLRNWCAVLLKQPFLTFGVIARIHWQALQLWIKGVTFHGRLSPSTKETS